MSDKSEQPSGGYEPNDPWAPPEYRAKPDGAGAQPPQPQGPSVHDQPTIMGMPSVLPGSGTGAGPGSGSAAVPPPPPAPGAPGGAPGAYGYPGVPPQQSAPGFQQPASPYAAVPGAGAGYGYPTAPTPGYPATPGYPGYGQSGWQQSPANGMGVAALVLGIISVVGFCFWGLSVILGVLALIFGIIGRRRAGRGEANNGGMALAGIILGTIGAVIGAAFLALIIAGVAYGEKNGTSDSEDPFATSFVVGADR
ncbi:MULTISPECIES: DUF4190 domain-containing protein [unclassified Streptomyces]|uniref:DUF4190 domain-containing protein n=1 Tax=unclassified Streptomyces TaxID=2593676 RepID=UPI002E2CF1D9|nr:DUF4190 domain-containing protein [Streptomyces sp. NBC_01429]